MKQREIHQFPLVNPAAFKKKLVSFYDAEKHLIYLESNQGNTKYDTYSTLIATGAVASLTATAGNAFDQLEAFRATHKDWMFGFLSYDLKNELEELESKHQDILEFPDMCFFVPELVFEISERDVKVHTFISSQTAVEQLIQNIDTHLICDLKTRDNKVILQARDAKEDYLKKAQTFLDHIHRGDIYEANFCTQFYAHEVELNPQKAFYDLNSISEPPFAVYAKLGPYYAISASPERYLKKTGEHLVSQPIKELPKDLYSPLKTKHSNNNC
jgi:para-aminobenzoate synthetase component 1